jgi:hypothetical protein
MKACSGEEDFVRLARVMQVCDASGGAWHRGGSRSSMLSTNILRDHISVIACSRIWYAS